MNKASPDLQKALTAATAAGTEFRASIEELRLGILELEEERSVVDNIPVPLDVALARLDRFMTSPVFKVFPGAGPFTHPKGRGYFECSDLATLLAPFVAPLIRTHYEAEIRKSYAGHSGISDERRTERLDALSGQKLRLEMAEERMIRAGESAGIVVPRRPDADPRAVLAFDHALTS